MIKLKNIKRYLYVFLFLFLISPIISKYLPVNTIYALVVIIMTVVLINIVADIKNKNNRTWKIYIGILLLSPFMVLCLINEAPGGVIEKFIFSKMFNVDNIYLQKLSASASNTYIVTMVGTVSSAIFGVIVGLLCVRKFNPFNFIFKGILESIESFPWLIVLMVVVGIIQIIFHQNKYLYTELQQKIIIGLTMGVIMLPNTSRFIYKLIEINISSEYVKNLQINGVSETKILLYNIIWNNILSLYIINLSFIFGNILIMDTSIDYILDIGFGDYGRTMYSTMGLFLAEGRHKIIFGNGFSTILPLVFTILGSNVLGEGLSKNILEK